MKAREAGQGLVEYALILVFVSIVVIAILLLLGPTEYPCDLVIGKEASDLSGGSSIVAGTRMKYTLYAKNDLVNPVPLVRVTDTLPNGQTPIKVRATDHLGEPDPDAHCYLGRKTVACYLERPSIFTRVIEIDTKAPPDPGTIQNTATISAIRMGGCTIETNPDNNVASTTVEVLPNPDLSLGDTTLLDLSTDDPKSVLGATGDSETVAGGEADTTDGADDVPEKIDEFLEHAEQQYESLRESRILLGEALDETLEILAEHAEEIGDEAFLDQLDTLRQEIAYGNLDAIVSALTSLGPRLALVLQDVQVVLVLKMEPLLIDACWTLDGAQVPFDSLDDAIQALEQREAESPGSTDDMIALMWKWWDQVESRNLLIQESTPILGSGIELGITWLEDTGDEALITRALEFEAQSEGCGD